MFRTTNNLFKMFQMKKELSVEEKKELSRYIRLAGFNLGVERFEFRLSVEKREKEKNAALERREARLNGIHVNEEPVPFDDKKNNMTYLEKNIFVLSLVFTSILYFAVLGILLAFSPYFSSINLKTIAIGYVIFISIPLIRGLVRRCPHCGSLMAMKLINSIPLSTRDSFKMVTRVEEHYNRSGKMVGTTERKEKVATTITTYENHFACRYCDGTKVSTSNTESEV